MKKGLISKEISGAISAIGCLMVLFSHFGSYLELRVFAPLGSGGVSLFLILSGYGLYVSNKERPLDKYWAKRVLRVLLPYWIVRVIFYLYSAIAGQMIDIKKLVLDLCVIQPLGPNCWYLSCAFFWYFCFWIYLRILKEKASGLYCVFFIGISISVLCLGSSLWAQQSLAFPIGIVIASKQDEVRRMLLKKKHFLLLCFGFICFFIGSIAMRRLVEQVPSLSLIEMVLKNVQNLSLSLLIILLLTHFSLPKGLLDFLKSIGTVSFEMYLLHGYFEMYIRQKGISVLVIVLPSIIMLSIMLRYSSNIIQRKMRKLF